MPPPPKKKSRQREEKSLVTTICLWAFVALGIGGIAWMIAVNPPEKRLNCRSTPTMSLIGFGSCTEE
jgi:hypothetical protein